MSPICLGVVGYGKIAQDQHVPALRDNPAFELAAVATLGAPCPGVAHFGSLRELLDNGPDIQALAFCTPPQGRYAQVREALEAGKHVLVEKPPCASLGEAMALVELAAEKGVTCLFAWHSRFAAGVEAARAWLVGKQLQAVTVQWKEDVRKWHPGQQWIWQAGGLGVFDPGINALSIISHVLPEPLFVTHASLRFPGNRQAPIAADLTMSDATGLTVSAAFDWDHGHDELWQIEVRCAEGCLRLTHGGAHLLIDDVPQTLATTGEYPLLYHYFAQLIEAGRSDTDLQPLRLVADGFLLGQRETVADFLD
ncbi:MULTISPECIES: Gfo/Idh/MocA family protein [unclassified Pseudomonas]|uniref:Gfo/Idh/MocA family protein n=1 Tax=unclassified Pseudomonas TaxID=196821 RepID=UPI00177B244E|nr:MULTISPECIES: Gfo/Idh/MocA family oxidoreductase [unclassified Pseudomonas]MBD8593364.1 Gfo/Idh/MocA family oxidoreductase [Pseudomonas sp. CFBP 8758]MBD8732523.1 Gfo/Idh/MocA family oxidoreductase [Pseudomonas sp. CFBP 13710]